MVIRLLMHILHRYYKRCGQPIFFVKGTEEHYPRYLLYTEDEDVYKRMDDF